MGKLYKQSLPLCKLGMSRPPNATDDKDAGFSVGSIWSWNGKIYSCTVETSDLAEWKLQGDRINGVVSGCEITVETFVGVGTNKRIRVGDGTWFITPSEYTKGTDTVSDEITLCPDGGDFKYYDIVADNTGSILIHEGSPDTAPSHYVINPLTEILLGFITVGDAVIEEPVLGPTDGLETFFEPIFVSGGVATLDCQEKAFPRFLISSLGSSPLEFVINNTFGVVEISIVIDIPAPNSDKGLITLPAFCYPTTYQISDNARYYSIKMTKYLGLLFCDFQALTDNSLKQTTKEFDLAFDSSETVFTKTHDLNNDKAIHWTLQMPDGSLIQYDPDIAVTKTATTITLTFAAAPSTGTGYLTVTGIQKEAIIPPEDEGFPYTLPLTF